MLTNSVAQQVYVCRTDLIYPFRGMQKWSNAYSWGIRIVTGKAFETNNNERYALFYNIHPLVS